MKFDIFQGCQRALAAKGLRQRVCGFSFEDVEFGLEFVPNCLVSRFALREN